MSTLLGCRAWLLVSTWASATGWLLGLTGRLNQLSYLLALLPLGGFLFKMIYSSRFTLYFSPKKFLFHRIFSFKRIHTHLPFLFFFVALLSFVGGVLYSPSNYDALSYRFPRILHWVSAGRWFWIDTANTRQNFSAAGFEWLMTPLFIFFKTDRLFFLINWIPFVLLPGLIFRTFRLAGLPWKTCWYWMWLIPLGYGYVLQSGGIGNDSFATIYSLSSVCFVLSGGKSKRLSDFGWGILSVALLTGSKGSNLPLALPWLVAMIFCFRVWFHQVWKLIPWAVIGLAVSFVPVAILNQHNTGHWSGDLLNQGKMMLTDPFAGFAGNFLMMGYGALQPPINPLSSKLNPFLSDHIPSSLQERLEKNFPRFDLNLGEIPMEESAGLGLGLFLCLLLMISARNPLCRYSPSFWQQPWFLIGFAGCASLLFYMAKMGSESAARLLLPYYPFTLILFLGIFKSTKKLPPRVIFLFLLLSSPILISMVLNPARALFPISRIGGLASTMPGWGRAKKVYETYAARPHTFKNIQALLPNSVYTLGFANNGDDLEAPLWRPFGFRRIISVNEETFEPSSMPVAQAWLVRRSVTPKLQASPTWSRDWHEAGSAMVAQKVSVGAEEWVVFLSP